MRLNKVAENFTPFNSKEFIAEDMSSDRSLFQNYLRLSRTDFSMRQITVDLKSQTVDRDFLDLIVSFNQMCITLENYKAISSHLLNLVFDKSLFAKTLFEYNSQLIEGLWHLDIHSLLEFLKRCIILRNFRVKFMNFRAQEGTFGVCYVCNSYVY